MPQSLSGLFNLDKPPGLTSHDVVAEVRRLTGQRKAGHAGTLDPLATGVLIVCLGKATRLIEYLVSGRKRYRTTIRFGVTTDTHDADGQILTQQDPSRLTENQIKAILPQFIGEISQRPPIFSAIKKDGQPLYKRARAGETVDVEPRLVTIDTLEWLAWQPPDLTIEVVCSPGTYIRALARDLGQAVGLGAHVVALRRTGSGSFSEVAAVTLDQLKVDWSAHLHPLDRAVTHLPAVTLNQAQMTEVQYGRSVMLPQIEDDLETINLLAAYTPTDQFMAILIPVDLDQHLWRPKKLFITA